MIHSLSTSDLFSNVYQLFLTNLFNMSESESEVAQSCPTLCDPVDCSPPSSSVHGILQARVLECVAISLAHVYRRHDHPDILIGAFVLGIPRWHNGKTSAYQCWGCKRLRFDSWVGKIPWRREWQPTPVFLPEEFQGQRSLAGYSL